VQLFTRTFVETMFITSNHIGQKRSETHVLLLCFREVNRQVVVAQKQWVHTGIVVRKGEMSTKGERSNARIAESVNVLPRESNAAHQVDLELHVGRLDDQLRSDLRRDIIPLCTFHFKRPLHIPLQLTFRHVVVASPRKLSQRNPTRVLAQDVTVVNKVWELDTSLYDSVEANLSNGKHRARWERSACRCDWFG
jgi:hypothetical protein